MAFNIHQRVFDRDGLPMEKKARQYQDELIRLFVESPEGKALLDEGLEPGWVDMMLDFGINYVGGTPPQMSPDNLREILFDLFPRKVSASADEAPEIIRELQACWQFMEREFHLENAAACLKVLDDKAARRLRREMSNPANFGMAKSFVMMGQERGFDMSTEEGINEWMQTYNAELAVGGGKRINVPFPFSLFSQEPSESTRKTQGQSRRRRNRRKR